MATKKTGLAESLVEESPEVNEATLLGENTPPVREERSEVDYTALAAPFEKTFQRKIRGGKVLDYITGEQTTSRLNEVVGVTNWDWQLERIEVQDGFVIARGNLTVRSHSDFFTSSTKAGVGGCEIKRLQGGTGLLDLSNDFKAAETSAFKRAAAKFGVGLYLYERDEAEAELPSVNPTGSYITSPNMQSLPPVSFPQNNSNGTSISGVIEQVAQAGIGQDGKERLGGIKMNGIWYNVSKYNKVDLTQYRAGMAVTIQHPAGKTFIDGLSPYNAAAPEPEEETIAF